MMLSFSLRACPKWRTTADGTGTGSGAGTERRADSPLLRTDSAQDNWCPAKSAWRFTWRLIRNNVVVKNLTGLTGRNKRQFGFRRVAKGKIVSKKHLHGFPYKITLAGQCENQHAGRRDTMRDCHPNGRYT